MPSAPEMSDATIARRTLAYVNRERAKRDLPALAELPKGRQVSACNCPVARGLSGTTPRREGEVRAASSRSGSDLFTPFEGDDPDPRYTSTLDLGDEYAGMLWERTEALRHPKSVQVFITRFDGDRYPELIE